MPVKNLKLVFVAVPLVGGILGTAYAFISEDALKPPVNKVRQPAKAAGFETGAAGYRAAGIKSLTGISLQTLPDGPGAGHSQRKSKTLPGVFRGDWGEMPVYGKNDRVNYQGAAYLSLEDENQNRSPSLNPAFWRRVKKAGDNNEEACYFPGPQATLNECDFTEENSLKDRDLSGADLNKARLNGELGAANLSGADLSGAAVIGSLIIGPDTRIDHANLSGLQSNGNNPLMAESANLSGTDFANANLYGAKMKGANLNGAKLTGATLTGADLASTHLESAELSKTDLTYANFSASSLSSSTLSQADLTEADLSRADLSLANLHDANIAGANLAGADLSSADLRGANLTDAQGADSALIDSQTDFMSAICPDGVTVDGARITTCVGHGF
ncbi:MAG: pentapeptide repeat-containing protein [Methylococcaceae bacterium]